MNLRRSRVSVRGVAGALLFVAGLAALSGVAMWMLMSRAKAAGEETCGDILRLAGLGEYEQIRDRSLATPRVVELLLERDLESGEVLSFHVTKSLAQALGTPWEVHCEVVRRKGTSEEVFNGSGRTVFHAGARRSEPSGLLPYQ